MGNTHLNARPKAPEDVYDLSMGPEPDRATKNVWQGSACPTEDTAGSYNVTVHTRSCVRHKRTVADFLQGEVIAIPFRTPNLNPRNKPDHPRLRLTCEGPVFSKNRMFLILYKYAQDMFCLPLFSYEGRGIGHKPENIKMEHVCLKMLEVDKFHNTGNYQPLEIRRYNPKRSLLPETVVSLTGEIKINASEDVAFVGRLTQESYNRLIKLYEARNNSAKKQGWDKDDPSRYFNGGKP